MTRLSPSRATLHLRTTALVALLVVSACTTTAVSKPLPDPLPATLEWAQAPAQEGMFLGLSVRENDSGSLEALAFDPGVRVTAVAPESPAADAGMRIGDVLLSLDGKEIHDPGGLENLLAEFPALGPKEAPVQAQVMRGDSVFELSFLLRQRSGGARPAERLWRADPARSQAGWLSGQGGVSSSQVPKTGPSQVQASRSEVW